MKYLYDAIVIGGFILVAVLVYLAYRRDAGEAIPPDPKNHCDLHKDMKCTHVDGFLCNVNTCKMLADYKEVKSTEGDLNA